MRNIFSPRIGRKERRANAFEYAGQSRRFFFNSLVWRHSCRTTEFASAIEKKNRCQQTYSPLDGFAIADGRSRFPRFTSVCDATRGAALPNGKLAVATLLLSIHSLLLLREIHSAREIAPRTKRNGSRRFYYTALKPGRLPLQSYRSEPARRGTARRPLPRGPS